MSDTITLTIVAGAKQGGAFVFDTHDTLLFGRMADCHICLPDDQQVSRHHFLLEVNPPDVRLRDLGSRNGTYINGHKCGGRQRGETPEEGATRQYPQTNLHDGDEIRVGRTVLRVRVEMEESPSVPMHCQRCGKDVSVEVGPRQAGDYFCSTCRQQAEADPDALLAELLQHASQAGRPDLDIHLPDYRVERELGKGGMGAVYLVRHIKRGQHAALKLVLAKVAVSERARQLFLREIEVTRSLRHPYVVEMLGSGAQGSLFYFLLEYCTGGSVYDLVKRRGGRLPLVEAGPILLQALEGLAFVHRQGVIHRDLKPQNILLSGREGQWTTKIADLGMAKHFEEAGLSGMTVTGAMGGSPAFMPREQVINFKYVQPVSDVWAMGATCYNMLTGSYPRSQQRGRDPMIAILQGEIVPIRQRDPTIPPRVAEVIDRALAQKDSERYQHAGEMFEALRKALL